MVTIAATGHRPKYLPCLYDEEHVWLKQLKSDLNIYLSETKPDVVISGMALGFDTWVAEAAINLGIDVHCYIPFVGQGDKWPWAAKQRYKTILAKAAKTVHISNQYSSECFKVRDQAMVNSADIVIALYNERELFSSGTGMTVRYAEKKSKQIVNFWKSPEAREDEDGTVTF